jgi:DNA-binding GntR family transcriptional regulator
LVADLSGNGRMAAVARDLVEQSDRLVRVSLRAIGNPDRSRLVAEHEAIIDAIRSRDGDAASRIARQHVADARTRVLTALKATEGNGT